MPSAAIHAIACEEGSRLRWTSNRLSIFTRGLSFIRTKINALSTAVHVNANLRVAEPYSPTPLAPTRFLMRDMNRSETVRLMVKGLEPSESERPIGRRF
jgi:hypothetical protein